jgi:hypothetical protein
MFRPGLIFCLCFPSSWMTGAHHHTQLFIDWSGVSPTLPRLAWNCSPPNLCTLHSSDYNHEPPCPVCNFLYLEGSFSLPCILSTITHPSIKDKSKNELSYLSVSWALIHHCISDVLGSFNVRELRLEFRSIRPQVQCLAHHSSLLLLTTNPKEAAARSSSLLSGSSWQTNNE